MKQFNRIILYARQHRTNSGVVETLHNLVEFLRAQGLAVCVDKDTMDGIHLDLQVLPRTEMGKAGDLIIVVGGDGSLLSGARMAIDVDVPILGINRGRLGFLTDISPHELESRLLDVLSGKFEEEQRFLLHTHIQNKYNTRCDALNDVVLGRGCETHLIAFDVIINDQFVSHFRSDGMILSTPTGSTAYCLSAGGPIMHPQLNAVVLVPMFSHSLSSRPLVVSGDAKIMLKISEDNGADLRISCDGHESNPVQPGTIVTIEKNRKYLRLLHPLDYHYYDTLRIKLGWGSRGY